MSKPAYEPTPVELFELHHSDKSRGRERQSVLLDANRLLIKKSKEIGKGATWP